MAVWMVEKKAQLMADRKAPPLDIELVAKRVGWKAYVMAETTAATKVDDSAAMMAE